jgi:hypothetical protein
MADAMMKGAEQQAARLPSVRKVPGWRQGMWAGWVYFRDRASESLLTIPSLTETYAALCTDPRHTLEEIANTRADADRCFGAILWKIDGALSALRGWTEAASTEAETKEAQGERARLVRQKHEVLLLKKTHGAALQNAYRTKQGLTSSATYTELGVDCHF